MAELSAAGAFDGLGLPLDAGGCRLSALPAIRRVSVAPFAGREAAVAAALGAGLPAFGRVAEIPGGRVLPFAIGQWLLEGGDVAALAGSAAVTEQGDGWAGLALGGPGARAALSRLVPLDLDPAAFPSGAMARSMLGHVPALLVAGATDIELLVPRSYARTVVRELGEAMRGTGARARPEIRQ